LRWWDARRVTAGKRELGATRGLGNRAWLINYVGSGFRDIGDLCRVAWLNFHVWRGAEAAAAG